MCFGIIIDSSSTPYQYKLRFNISNDASRSDGPNPTTKITQDAAIDLTIYGRSISRGMIGANTLVNTAIFQQ